MIHVIFFQLFIYFHFCFLKNGSHAIFSMIHLFSRDFLKNESCDFFFK